MAMDQYLLIPFLGGWTSIYQLFWCSPGVQGFDPPSLRAPIDIPFFATVVPGSGGAFSPPVTWKNWSCPAGVGRKWWGNSHPELGHLTQNHEKTMAGWWFGTFFIDFWNCPQELGWWSNLTFIFYMGVAQPPSRWEFCVITQMYRIKGHMKQTKMMVSHTVFWIFVCLPYGLPSF